MRARKKEFRKGAASFYIVAFSTLILMIVATSFAAVIISETTRTSNDDLSQSAYDAALAGVEDAKLLYQSYQNCVLQGTKTSDCQTLIATVESGATDCDMVGKSLGRTIENGIGVPIQSSKVVNNNMQQYYTCVKMETVLNDFRSSLSASDMIRVAKVKFDDGVADKIDKVKISWYDDLSNMRYWSHSSSGLFQPIGLAGVAAPPVISLAMVQTAQEFNFSDFNFTVGETTDRGMVYLVPTNNKNNAGRKDRNNYIGAWNGKENSINKWAFLESNDKTVANSDPSYTGNKSWAGNLPYMVYCDGEGTFACSTTIEIPRPVTGWGGSTKRNDNTFVFVVGLPYGKPATNFSLEFFCGEAECGGEQTIISAEDKSSESRDNKRAYLKETQIRVDSTGRANDLFRRVEMRLQNEGEFGLSIMGPLELLGTENGFSMEKNFAVTSEWNFQN